MPQCQILQQTRTWARDARFPALADAFFYIPKLCERFAIAMPLVENLFANKNPLAVEFCSGNGLWVVEKAQEVQGKNWIAVEKRFDRAKKIWARMQHRKLKNLLVVCGEAAVFSKHYLLTESVTEVYINFPDPWPKRRHEKNRLLNTSFVEDLLRILATKGSCTLVTDDPDYRDNTLEVMKMHPRFLSFFPDPFYVTDYPGYGNSFFESLWREKGKKIFYLRFIKL